MPLQNSLEFSKLYCQTHPGELISNYCNDEKCLVGLCATCICSHTVMHAQIGTIPQYQNIRDVFCVLHDELRSQISQIEETKCKLGSVRQSVEVKKIVLKKTIKKLKSQAIAKVKEEFDMIEKKILVEVNTEEKKQGFHSSIRFQSLSKSLNRQTQAMLQYIEGLNSTSFLDWARKLKREAITQSKANRIEIENQIFDNEMYTANLKWNQNFLSQIENSIRKIFTLQFIIPKPNIQFKHSREILKSTIKHFNSTRPYSQPKLHQNSLIKSNSITDFGRTTAYGTLNPTIENTSLIMSKITGVKKHEHQMPGYENDLAYQKENCMAKSLYISQNLKSDMLNRSNMMNSFSAFGQPIYQNQRLSALIQAKKASRFQNLR